MRNYCKKYFPVVIILLCTFVIIPLLSLAEPNIHSKKNEAELLLRKAEVFYDNSDYKSSLSCLNKCAQISKISKDWNTYTKCLIKIGRYYTEKGNYDLAYEYLKDAKYLIDKYQIKELIISSEILYEEAKIQTRKEQYTVSNKTLTNLFILYNKSENNPFISLSYILSGNNNYYSGYYDKALLNYKEALKYKLKQDVNSDFEIADIYMNIGMIYKLVGKFDEAGEYYLRSLYIKQNILKPNDLKLANTYRNLNLFYTDLGNYSEALNYAYKSINIYINKFGKDYYKLAKLNLSIGNIYYYLKDYEKALDYYNKSLLIYKKNEKISLSSIYCCLGNVYYVKKSYDQALLYYEQAYESTSSDHPAYAIYYYAYFARCYNKLGKTEDAENYFKQAVKKKIDFYGKDHYELARTYTGYGDFCLENGFLKKAHGLFSKALAINLKYFGNKHPNVSESYADMGDYRLAQEDPEKAIVNYQKALISIVEDFNESDIYKNPETDRVISENKLLYALKSKAKAFRLLAQNRKELSDYLRDMKMSLVTFEKAAGLADKMRIGYTGNESKMFLAANEKDTYIKTIETALDLYNKTGEKRYFETAFKYSERSKSATLLASIRNLKAVEFGGIPQKWQMFEKKLRQEIPLYKKFILEENQKKDQDKKKIDLWEAKLFDLNRKYDKLIKYYEKKYPDYYALKYDTKVIGPDELQRKLKNNETLISYVLSEDHLYTFVISKNNYKVFTGTIDNNFIDELEAYRNCLSYPDVGHHNTDDYKDFISSSYCLYNYLIKPAEQLICNKNLIIVPDEILATIPFETLITELPDFNKLQYNYFSYLIKEHPVSYSYSATLRYNTYNYSQPEDLRILAFAPEYLKNNENSSHDNIVSRNRLRPIPGAYDEVENITNIFKGSIYTGKKATADNFKKYVQDYNILHLAMHALLDDEHPMYSKLVFTNTGQNTGGNCYLNSYEIYNMRLNAGLVVLSACNTGSGKINKGEGIMNMARSFMYAGCPSIVMTLWEVEDRSSTYLMTSFYTYLSEGFTKDEALRKAKLDYLNNNDPSRQHPYYWSAYVSIGDASPLQPAPEESETEGFFSFLLNIFNKNFRA